LHRYGHSSSLASSPSVIVEKVAVVTFLEALFKSFDDLISFEILALLAEDLEHLHSVALCFANLLHLGQIFLSLREYGMGTALGAGLLEGLIGGTSCPYPDRVFLSLLLCLLVAPLKTFTPKMLLLLSRLV
jgi:hypothetical protein